VRSACISLILCSTVLTGCTALGLQDESEAKKPAQHSKPNVTGESGAKKRTPARATTIAATRTSEKLRANNAPKQTEDLPTAIATSTTPGFKGPKALEDMRAFSMNTIRGTNGAMPTSQNVSATPENVFVKPGALSTKPRTTKPEMTDPETVAVAKPRTSNNGSSTNTVANSATITKADTNNSGSIKTTTAVVAVAAPQAAPSPAESDLNATQQNPAKANGAEITAEQANQFLEKNPTAAGVETIASLDIPREQQPIPTTTTVINNGKADMANDMTNDRVAKPVKKAVARAAGAKRPASVGLWEIQENWDGAHPGQCRLSTRTMQIDNDGYATQLSLDVIDGKLLVNSSTNINIGLKDVGIRFDNGWLEKFSENRFASSAFYDGNLAETLQRAKKLNIVLGGDELGKRRHQKAIPLNDLREAFFWYQDCNNKRIRSNGLPPCYSVVIQSLLIRYLVVMPLLPGCVCYPTAIQN
jgi:hypothetical protein